MKYLSLSYYGNERMTTGGLRNAYDDKGIDTYFLDMHTVIRYTFLEICESVVVAR